MKKLISLFAIASMIFIGCNKEKNVIPEPTDPVITPVNTYTVGQSYGGGIVFYVDSTGKHGLIAATADVLNSHKWGVKSSVPGARDTAIGTGKANTDTIVSFYDSGAGLNPNYAAKKASEFTLNNYEDWYLPSKCELYLLYINRAVVGSFSNEYWSSSEVDKNSVYTQEFNTGYKLVREKDYNTAIRCIRSF